MSSIVLFSSISQASAIQLCAQPDFLNSPFRGTIIITHVSCKFMLDVPCSWDCIDDWTGRILQQAFNTVILAETNAINSKNLVPSENNP